MKLALPFVSFLAAITLAMSTGASADTVVYTMTVPITVKAPSGPLKAGDPNAAVLGIGKNEQLKKFVVACAIGGSSLAYSSGGGSAQNAIATGTSDTNGGSFSQNWQKPDGSFRSDSGSATVVLSFEGDPGKNSALAGGSPTQYVCWAKFPDVQNAPLFLVQGQLKGQS